MNMCFWGIKMQADLREISKVLSISSYSNYFHFSNILMLSLTINLLKYIIKTLSSEVMEHNYLLNPENLIEYITHKIYINLLSSICQ